MDAVGTLESNEPLCRLLLSRSRRGGEGEKMDPHQQGRPLLPRLDRTLGLSAPCAHLIRPTLRSSLVRAGTQMRIGTTGGLNLAVRPPQPRWKVDSRQQGLLLLPHSARTSCLLVLCAHLTELTPGSSPGRDGTPTLTGTTEGPKLAARPLLPIGRRERGSHAKSDENIGLLWRRVGVPLRNGDGGTPRAPMRLHPAEATDFGD